jgi:hypothetical protein
VARRLPDDPAKRRQQVFKRIYQHLEHIWALAEDRGMDRVITDPETGEDIYVSDLLVGLDSLPPRQRQAFELICLQGYTETAARDEMLPNSKSSTPVQQYADSGLVRVIDAYDAYQAGRWPPPALPKSIKKTKRRFTTMAAAALHPLLRQGLEATKKKILAEIEGLKVALQQVDGLLEGGLKQPEPAPASNGIVTPPIPPATPVSEDKPDIKAMAQEMVAAAKSE